MQTPMFSRPVAAAILVWLVSLPAFAAQVATEGSWSVGGGGAFLDGDRAAFQKAARQRKDGYGGLESFTVSRSGETSFLRFDARAVPGNADYKFALQWEQFDRFYVNAGFHRFRTFYDGSGGRLLPRDLAISYFDEDLAVDRTFLFVEVGSLVRQSIQWRIRYDRLAREGSKNSIRWGDSNLGGAPFTTRAFIPSYLLIDEARDQFTAEVGQRTEVAQWKVVGRYQRTRVLNRHVARRRALEPQDRYLTMRDGYDADSLSGHGSFERAFGEKLRVSAGGISTSIDTQLVGSRIYGNAPDSAYAPVIARGQANDAGYIGLAGTARLRQYVGNLNAHYLPAKYLAIIPAVKYEHLRQDSGEQHTETTLTGTAAAAAERQIEAASRDSWNEVTEDLELRLLRWADWRLYARGQWNQGTGNLVEQSILAATRASVIDRDSDYERIGQRYTVGATWFARPGLTVGATWNRRYKQADYRARRDLTSNAVGNRDRYPHFMVDNDIASEDLNLRLSWRPFAGLSFTTRYARQRAMVTTTFDNLPEIDQGQLRRHVVTQNVMWQILPRWYVSGTANVTYDRLRVPAHRLTVVSDNNYVSANLATGYALGKVTDLLLDVSHYRADNYSDNAEFTLPLNAGQTLHSSFLTWVRRHSDRLVFTAKYGFASNRDGTYGGQNDFTAHVVYGKVEYRF